MGTPSPNEEWAARARSFGNVALQYDRARPSYPAAMVDDIVAMLPGRRVVEVGAGTGKATVSFGVRRLALTCVEPDPRMAAVLAENCRSMPDVEVVVSTFEGWQPTGSYDGLLAAQSWHWTDGATRYQKAAAVLRERGVLALFWNHVSWRLTPIHAAIDDVYRRHGIDTHDNRSPSRTNPSAFTDDSLRDELSKLPTFSDVDVRRYPTAQTYSAREWCDYLGSTSDHLLLEPAAREGLLADIARVIDDEGAGVIEIHRCCDLYLAWRTGVPV